MQRTASFVLLLATLVPTAFGQDEDSERAEYERWLSYYQDVANAYDIYLKSDPKTRLLVTPKPLMAYSHPSAMRGTHGAFFVWKCNGRPELIGWIWLDEIPGGMRTVMYEFHSLSLEPLAPVQVGNYIWAPESGIEIRPIPNAEPPMDSAALRLAQMRSLAQDLTGFSTPHGRELRLRMLRQPLPYIATRASCPWFRMGQSSACSKSGTRSSCC